MKTDWTPEDVWRETERERTRPRRIESEAYAASAREARMESVRRGARKNGYAPEFFEWLRKGFSNE